MEDEYAIENATIAYSAYGESIGWRAFNGDPMPATLNDLPEPQRTAWIAAAEAVAIKVQMDPPTVPAHHRALEAPTGYEYYLAGKYGGAGAMDAVASSLGDAPRCPDLRCVLPAGHSGLHEDPVSRWTDPIPMQRGPFDAR